MTCICSNSSSFACSGSSSSQGGSEACDADPSAEVAHQGISELVALGYDIDEATVALAEVGGKNVDAAAARIAGISQLVAMGYGRDEADMVLTEEGGDVEAAAAVLSRARALLQGKASSFHIHLEQNMGGVAADPQRVDAVDMAVASVEEAKQRAGEFLQRTSATAEEMKQRGSELLQRTGATAEEARQRAGELLQKTGVTAEEMKQRTGDLMQRAGSAAEEAKQRTGALLQQTGAALQGLRASWSSAKIGSSPSVIPSGKKSSAVRDWGAMGGRQLGGSGVAEIGVDGDLRRQALLAAEARAAAVPPGMSSRLSTRAKQVQ